MGDDVRKTIDAVLVEIRDVLALDIRTTSFVLKADAVLALAKAAALLGDIGVEPPTE